jgi:hypothetical protein
MMLKGKFSLLSGAACFALLGSTWQATAALMSRFIALAAVLAMLAAAASAKTLKVSKSEVVQHRVVEPVQHRTAPAEPVDPAILHTHFQKLRTEGASP